METVAWVVSVSLLVFITIVAPAYFSNSKRRDQ